MQRQIILTLALPLLLAPALAQGQTQRLEAALLVSECVSREGLCEFQQLVKYSFRDNESVTREVISIEPTERVRYDLGQSRLYRGRYVITNWGDVIDIEKKQLLHNGIGEFVGVEGDRIIQKVDRRDVRGFFYYDLKSGKYSRLRLPSKWALPGLLSPHQTKSVSVDEWGNGKIWLHRLNGRKRLLASGISASSYGCSFPKPPVLWLSDQKLLSQRRDGELVVIDMRGRMAPLVTLPIKSDETGPLLDRDDAGQIVYTLGSEAYTIDVENRRYSRLNPDWVDLSSGFEWETSNSTAGRAIRFQKKEIGRWWALSMRTTTGHIAVEYGDIGYVFGIPKGLKVWSSSNKTWTTIDPPWLNRVIGWIE